MQSAALIRDWYRQPLMNQQWIIDAHADEKHDKLPWQFGGDAFTN